MRVSKTVLSVPLLGALLGLAAPAQAFERDVHLGLTQWLAMQAGFGPDQAQAIAIGDQRVDSGDVQFTELVGVYACAGKDAESAGLIQFHHFPSAAKLPAPAAERAVVAGGEAARKGVDEVLKVDPNMAGFTLYKLGEALHALQDSWSHQGVPELPRPLPGVLACDPGLAWGAPEARGGWNSHKPDLTWAWPADTLQMAEASYKVLLAYPPIGGVRRTAAGWDRIRPMLDAFVAARTKADKQKWFVDHDIKDVSFLAGISLPDGTATPFEPTWTGNRMPRLASVQSGQHHVDPPLLDFFNGLFAKWIASDDFAATAAQYGASAGATGGAATRAASAQLAARLAVWRVRDHGSVAELAHAPEPFTARQLQAIRALAKKPKAFAHPADPSLAFIPLLPKTEEPAPFVPFLITALPASAEGRQRAIATVKFSQAPYDSLEVLSEKNGERWGVVAIAPVVEH
jgi:hypothetical protein